MRAWFREFIHEWQILIRHCGTRIASDWKHFTSETPPLFRWAVVLPFITFIAALTITALYRPGIPHPGIPESLPSVSTPHADLTTPVREEPKRFRRNTTMPPQGEGASSVSIGQVPFLPEHDLVQVYDKRVWWESEHDYNDTEDDHVMHKAIEEPFRRLVELVDQAGGRLKVQDAYRDVGIHAKKSLHKEGRALDLTSEVISLEKLASLCWAAGFDWVYYEAPKRGGHHIHVSVRPGPGLSRPEKKPEGRFFAKE